MAIEAIKPRSAVIFLLLVALVGGFTALSRAQEQAGGEKPEIEPGSFYAHPAYIMRYAQGDASLQLPRRSLQARTPTAPKVTEMLARQREQRIRNLQEIRAERMSETEYDTPRAMDSQPLHRMPPVQAVPGDE